MNGQSALGMMNVKMLCVVDANSTHKLSAVVVSVSATAIDCGDGSDLSTADSD